MSPLKVRALLVIFLLIIGGTFLSTLGAGLAEADLLVTPTLIAREWNYLPVVRGLIQGPTTTPRPPLPTLTASPTLTPSPTVTASATGEATQEPTATNTSTSTPPSTATNTPQPTNTPTNTRPPETSNTGDVRITEILFDGVVSRVESDEYVEIQNYDDKIVRLKGWKLHDEGVKHTYTFPTYNLQPGEVCRVYTNENHPEWCGLNWGNGGAIWNNDGDEATLKDGSGTVIDTCSYSGSGTKKNCE